MRLVFAGTPEFAVPALIALLQAGHEVPWVLTQPDRPAGRGLKTLESPVKQLAISRNIRVLQPVRLNDSAVIGALAAVRPDVLVVAAYGLILPPAVLDLAPHGAVNIHASLLPRWRGAAPIQRAIMAGDRETGISIMRMEAGLDTGPVGAQGRVAIANDDDAGTLHHRLSLMGAEMIVAALHDIAANRMHWRKQPDAGVCYAHKIEKREALVDWSRPAVEIERLVRALRPGQTAQAQLRGERIKIWRCTPAPGSGPAGTVLEVGDRGIVIACGRDAVSVTELQRPGGRHLDVGAFLHGFAIAPGEQLAAQTGSK